MIKHKLKRLQQKFFIWFLYSKKTRQIFRENKQRQIRAGKNKFIKPKVKSTVKAGEFTIIDFYKNIKTY